MREATAGREASARREAGNCGDIWSARAADLDYPDNGVVSDERSATGGSKLSGSWPLTH